MKRLLLLLLICTVSFAQVENNLETYQQIDNIKEKVLQSRWIDRYFLTKRIFLYPLILSHKEDLGVTEEQMFNINRFYVENLPKMIEKADKVKELEAELYDLTLHGGNPKSIKEKIINIAKLKAELTALNIKEIRTVQNILTTDQYENLLEYLGQNDND